jgi:hypothetical protein
MGPSRGDTKMRYCKLFVWLALAAGVALPGASTLSAQEPYGRDTYQDRRDLRNDRRDLSNDYARVNRLRADLDRDQGKLNEAVRCGRRWEAEQIRRDMARDRAALDAQLRDIHRDRVDMSHDRRDLQRDYYRNSWR